MKFSKSFAAAAALVVASVFSSAQAAPAGNDNHESENLVQLTCVPSEGFDDKLKSAFDMVRMPESGDIDTGKIRLYANEANDRYVIVLEMNAKERAANNIPVEVSCLIGQPSYGLKELRASPSYGEIFPKP